MEIYKSNYVYLLLKSNISELIFIKLKLMHLVSENSFSFLFFFFSFSIYVA